MPADESPVGPIRITAGAAWPARGVRRLLTPVVAHAIEDPTTYDNFATFHCGDHADESDTDAAVQEVERTASRLYTDNTEMPQQAVVLEDGEGHLIGYCSVHRRLGPRSATQSWIAQRYITAYGRDIGYRNCVLRDGATRVGEALIRAGLDMIALTATGAMPSVSALVKPNNPHSRRALEACGFICAPTTVTGLPQDLLWRNQGLPLAPPLPLDVYEPPEPLAPTIRAGRNELCPCGSGRKFKRCCAR